MLKRARMRQSSRITYGIHYATGRVIRLGTGNGVIQSISPVDESVYRNPESRAELPVIAPGLVDLQVNGFMGVDFNAPDLTPEMIRKASVELRSMGIASYFPTLITGPVDRISASLLSLAGAMNEKAPGSGMPGGIHLEGPFISPEEGPRGAHPKNYCLLPDTNLVKKWQDIAEGRLCGCGDTPAAWNHRVRTAKDSAAGPGGRFVEIAPGPGCLLAHETARSMCVLRGDRTVFNPSISSLHVCAGVSQSARRQDTDGHDDHRAGA